MPEADKNHTPARRRMLGHVVGAATATVIVNSCTTVRGAGLHPDAVVLSLAAALEEIDRVTAADNEALLDASGEEADRLYERLDPYTARWLDLHGRLVKTPALTREGQLAKARIVSAQCHTTASGDGMEIYDHELAWSLLQDIVRSA